MRKVLIANRGEIAVALPVLRRLLPASLSPSPPAPIWRSLKRISFFGSFRLATPMSPLGKMPSRSSKR